MTEFLNWVAQHWLLSIILVGLIFQRPIIQVGGRK